MKKEDDLLDALREEWTLYGERIGHADGAFPPTEIVFSPVIDERRGRWLAAAVVAWVLLTVAAVRWFPRPEPLEGCVAVAGHHVSHPADAVATVQMLLEKS